MYLQLYQTPSAKAFTTVVSPGQPLPENQSRRWLLLQNMSDSGAAIAFSESGPIAISLDPKELISLPSPVYIGSLWALSGTFHATEMF